MELGRETKMSKIYIVIIASHSTDTWSGECGYSTKNLSTAFSNRVNAVEEIKRQAQEYISLGWQLGEQLPDEISLYADATDGSVHQDVRIYLEEKDLV